MPTRPPRSPFRPTERRSSAAATTKLVKFWNPATGELIRTLSGHTGWVVSLAFSHDGQTLASGSYDRSIRLWNVADGARAPGADRPHGDGSLAGLFAQRQAPGQRQRRPDRAAVGRGQRPGASHACRPRGRGAERGVFARRSAAGLGRRRSDDQSLERRLHTICAVRSPGHTDMVSAVAFAQQTLVSTSWDRTIRTWDADALESRGNLTVGPERGRGDGRRPGRPPPADRRCRPIADALEVDGRRGPADGPLGQYRAFPWTRRFFARWSQPWPSPPAESSEETDLYLYDVATKAEKYQGHLSGQRAQHRLCSGGRPAGPGLCRANELLLVDAATRPRSGRAAKQPADAPPSARRAVDAGGVLGRWQTAGRHLATTTTSGFMTSSTARSRKPSTVTTTAVLSIAFSPDQKRTDFRQPGQDGHRLGSGKRRKRYRAAAAAGHGVASVAFSPDGKLLATGSGTDICCLWHAETGSLLQTLAAHQGTVYEVRFSPDGKLLATGGEDRPGKAVGRGDRQTGANL